MDDDADELMNDFDLVLTTVTHYDTVANSLTGNKEKLMAADVSLSRKTIVSICALPHECSLGILCQSNKFANLIMEQLEVFASHRKNVPVCFDTDTKAIRRFMRRFSAIIAAPNSPIFDPSATWKKKTLTDFRAKELMVQIFKDGELVYDLPSLKEIREYSLSQVDLLWDEVKRFSNPHAYYVDLSQKLWDIKQDMIRRSRGQ